MRISARFTKVSLLAVVCAVGLTASPAQAEGKGSGKAKGKQNIATKENHGRETNELPFGLEQHIVKKGALPSGIQKQKDEESLPRGLEEGAKSVKSAAKGKKVTK